jgi:hypothetical protein
VVGKGARLRLKTRFSIDRTTRAAGDDTSLGKQSRVAEQFAGRAIRTLERLMRRTSPLEVRGGLWFSGSVKSVGMRIELDDQSYVADLVRFLRERRCLAYVPGKRGTIEVIRTLSFGKQEADEIRQLASERQTTLRRKIVLCFSD